jgi:hypothetical protein
LSPSEAKVQHRVLLTARQIYISIDPNDAERPTSHTIEDQRKLRDNLSRWLNKDVWFENPDYNNPRAIRGVKILKNFDVLIETDTEANAELFKKHSTSILSNLCPTAGIRQCKYTLIFKFVPCSGGFDPYDDVNLREIESDNDAPPNSIVSASWAKHPTSRQQTLRFAVWHPRAPIIFLRNVLEYTENWSTFAWILGCLRGVTVAKSMATSEPFA